MTNLVSHNRKTTKKKASHQDLPLNQALFTVHPFIHPWLWSPRGVETQTSLSRHSVLSTHGKALPEQTASSRKDTVSTNLLVRKSSAIINSILKKDYSKGRLSGREGCRGRYKWMCFLSDKMNSMDFPGPQGESMRSQKENQLTYLHRATSKWFNMNIDCDSELCFLRPWLLLVVELHWGHWGRGCPPWGSLPDRHQDFQQHELNSGGRGKR